MIGAWAAAGVAAASRASEGSPTDGGAADSCEGKPISRVEVVPRNIFDPAPTGRFSFVYHLANRLHVTTRTQTVNEQLVFQPGDRWSPERGRESARNLRALDFLAPAPFEASCQDDSVTVRVVTRDVWSTRPEFALESAGDHLYGAVGLSERNFLGLGVTIAIAYRDLPGGRARSMSYFDPGVLGSRHRMRLAASTGTAGATDEVSLGLPFYAEDTRHSHGVSWSRTTSVYSLYDQGALVADFNRRMEQSEVTWGSGARADGRVRRLVWSYESIDRRLGPTQVLAPDVPEEFLGGEESLRLRRVAVEGRLWHPAYIERTRINEFGLVEDFDLGASASLKLGYAPKLFGSSQDEGYARLRCNLGADTPLGFGQLDASLSSRIQTIALETIGQVDARWFAQYQPWGTFVLAARGGAAREASRDFQLVVGGLNGLRAYPTTAVAGDRLWRLNAENRWTVGERFWESLTVGVVAFADAAHAWGPGSGGAGWFVDAGVGLRLSLPQWSLGQVLRVDTAWPLEPTPGGTPAVTVGSSQAF